MNGCPENMLGCRNGRCQNTCYCEDHCSWDKCVLVEKPDDCLDEATSQWIWDGNKNFWVAQLTGRHMNRIQIFQL